jgi:hypothetical protein
MIIAHCALHPPTTVHPTAFVLLSIMSTVSEPLNLLVRHDRAKLLTHSIGAVCHSWYAYVRQTMNFELRRDGMETVNGSDAVPVVHLALDRGVLNAAKHGIVARSIEHQRGGSTRAIARRVDNIR